MRRQIKKRLLDMVTTLQDATRILRLKGNGLLEERRAVLLEQCQNSAIEIGQAVENEGAEGAEAVRLLEEYCESLYLVYNESPRKETDFRPLKKAERLLACVYKEIKYTIQDDKIEIAFLPYMASMWDCMESIWAAAKDDTECDCYVVPIPYYDKKEDGSVGTWHYEGNLFAPDVTVTDWKQYDIPSRKPDIIYIHNPYDDMNTVTSVHPDFYAGELKKYTKELVYVPYFIQEGETPEHLCVLPGTVYADKVIVQSEEARMSYIKAFQKYERDFNCPGRFGNIQEKFTAMGSPKLELVVQSRMEDFVLPDEWTQVIRGRKVILYNTSIALMLAYRERYLEKIEEVLQFFKENTESVLWWRPHPLAQAVLGTMLPGEKEKYEKIVEEYIKSGFGIYDDTPQLHRAICLADAYYGDAGSLLSLFKITGKPIMLQNFIGGEGR